MGLDEDMEDADTLRPLWADWPSPARSPVLLRLVRQAAGENRPAGSGDSGLSARARPSRADKPPVAVRWGW